MKKLIFLFIISLLSCKKEIKSNPVKVNNHIIHKKAIDTLTIIGNQIWIRETPKTGKVVLKLDNKTVCTLLEKGIKDTIREQIDYWYKIKFNNQEGWIFGSQTTKSMTNYVPNDFKPFIKDFLQNCFIDKNTDSLLQYKSPIIYKYINKKIGFTRYHNPGITCIPQEYDDHNYYSKNYPKINLDFYPEKELKDGFCDKSTNKDGVYFHYIKQLPKYPVWLKDKEDYKMMDIKLPKNCTDNPKIEVTILHKKWIIKRLYFIKNNDKWYLVLSDDCDCSA